MSKRLAAWIDAVGNGLLRLATACFDVAYTLDPARLEEEDRAARDTQQSNGPLPEHIERWVLQALNEPAPERQEPEALEVTAVKWVERTNEAVYLLPQSALRHRVN